MPSPLRINDTEILVMRIKQPATRPDKFAKSRKSQRDEGHSAKMSVQSL